MSDLLENVSALSHEFGTSEYVLGGGGNTSAKTGDHLWIKPSGTCLPDMTPESFLQMDRSLISKLYSADPPKDPGKREAMVGDMLMAARCQNDGGLRPSVETPLHNAFESTYVVHVHPPMVGGMLCCINSKAICSVLFPDALYMEYTDPGYTLSIQTRERIIAYRNKLGHDPSVVFMENHGLFVAGDTVEAVRKSMNEVMTSLKSQYEKSSTLVDIKIGPMPDPEYAKNIRMSVAVQCGEAHAQFYVMEGPFDVATAPLTPDHIVYMKAFPLVGEPTEKALADFMDKHGYSPRIVSTERGVVALGSTSRNAELAMMLAKDGALVTRLAGAFGGVRYMDEDAGKFIDNWEVEAYRRKVASEQ